MGMYQVYGWGIGCDMPDCYACFEILGLDEGIVKMAEVIGWVFIDFPGEQSYTDSHVVACPKCTVDEEKGIVKEATDDNHDCIYIRKTKTGKPSHYGKYLSCFICGKIKK